MIFLIFIVTLALIFDFTNGFHDAANSIAAISWNLLTWYYGIPSSSSHTLIGGLVGAAVAAGGFSGVNSAPIIKTIVFMVLSPIVGMILAMIVTTIVIFLSRNTRPRKAES